MSIFASVFLALNEAGVPFLVIGGHAVVLHGLTLEYVNEASRFGCKMSKP